ncbi:MAG: hypothetical protein ABI870_13400 [Rhodanobacter sp.]
MSERSARLEHNSQFSVPPVFGSVDRSTQNVPARESVDEKSKVPEDLENIVANDDALTSPVKGSRRRKSHRT